VDKSRRAMSMIWEIHTRLKVGEMPVSELYHKRRGISPAERDYPQQIISSPTSFDSIMEHKVGKGERGNHPSKSITTNHHVLNSQVFFV